MRWAFYLFVASIAFEYPGRSIPLEVTTITASIFLVATIIQPGRCFARAPSALWCFVVFLYCFWVSFAVGGAVYANEAMKSFAAFSQLLLVLWAAYNLLRDDRVATGALLTLGIACTALAVLTVFGERMNPNWVRHSGRVAVLEQNANRAGLVLASGALVLVGLTYARRVPLFRPRILVWPLLIVIAVAMLEGASRGSLLAFVVGLWTFTVGAPTLFAKVRNTLAVILTVGLLSWAVWQTPLMRSRVERAEQLDLAGREVIIPTLGRMFLERPIFGWGPNQNKYELAYRLPGQEYLRRDTHNLMLEVITSTGLLGAIPFGLGTALCVWGAWRARRGAYGALPFALTAAILTANMSSNYIAFKLHWFVLAYGAAAGSLVARRPPPVPRRTLRFAPAPPG